MKVQAVFSLMQNNHSTHDSFRLSSNYTSHRIISALSFTFGEGGTNIPLKPAWILYDYMTDKETAWFTFDVVLSAVRWDQRHRWRDVAQRAAAYFKKSENIFFLFASGDTDRLSHFHYSTSSLCLNQVPFSASRCEKREQKKSIFTGRETQGFQDY